jgi:hypothetical protein
MPTCFECAIIDHLSIRWWATEKVLRVDILSAVVKILRAAKSVDRLLDQTQDFGLIQGFAIISTNCITSIHRIE